jgi:hypothetical protein
MTHLHSGRCQLVAGAVSGDGMTIALVRFANLSLV